jgi:hypothetical protein
MKQLTSQGYSENILTPVTLSGVVVPWAKIMKHGKESDYKLVCASGVEYFFVTDSEWRKVLSFYCWDEVKVVGLLNISNMTLIPQKVFPKGPTGEREKVIDLVSWKSRDAVRKIIKNINDWAVVPAAAWATIAA